MRSSLYSVVSGTDKTFHPWEIRGQIDWMDRPPARRQGQGASLLDNPSIEKTEGFLDDRIFLGPLFYSGLSLLMIGSYGV